MTVFRDQNAARRERVRTCVERIADDLAGIDPLVRAHANRRRLETIATAEGLVERARELDALEGGALAALEQSLDDLLDAVAAMRAESPARRRELLSIDHPLVPSEPRAFTSHIEDMAWTFGRRSGAEGLEATVQKQLSWASDLALRWVVDPRKAERSYLDLFIAHPLWGALAADFVFKEVAFHLLCETQAYGGNVNHHVTMSVAVAASLGTTSFRFMPEMEPHLPRALGKPLAALARFDVPQIRVERGTAHVHASFDIDPRMLTAMRAILLALRELPPLVPLRDLVHEARVRAGLGQ